MEQSKTKRFLQNALVVAFAALAMRTVAVWFGAFVSGRVGKEGMGIYSLVMSVYNFAITLATSGVHLAVTRTVSEALGKGNEAEAKRAMRHSLLYAAAFGSLSGGILLLFAKPIGVGFLRDLRTVPALRVLGISMLPFSLSSAMNGYFIARRKARYNAAAQVFEQAVRIFAITFLLTLALPKGLEYATLAMVLGGVLAEVLCFAFMGVAYLLDSRKIKGGIEKKVEISMLKTLFSIAGPVAFSAYIRSGLLTVEHALIPLSIEKFGRTRAQALADYGLLQGMALPIVLYPSALLFSVAGLLVPEFAERKAKGEKEGILSLCKKTFAVTSAFGFGAATLLLTFSRELGMLAYRSFETGDYIFALAFVLPIMFLDHVTDCALKGVGEQLWTMWVNIADAIVSILLVMLLLPKMGIFGYVLVIILAELVNFGFSYGRLLFVTGYRPHLRRELLLPAASAVTAYFLTRLLLPMDSTSASLVWTVLRMVFCASVYIFCYILGGEIKSRRPLLRQKIAKTKENKRDGAKLG